MVISLFVTVLKSKSDLGHTRHSQSHGYLPIRHHALFTNHLILIGFRLKFKDELEWEKVKS